MVLMLRFQFFASFKIYCCLNDTKLMIEPNTIVTKCEIERCESRKLNLQTKFMDEEITSSDFHEMKTKVEKDLTILKERLYFLRQKGTPYKNYVTKEIPMLENLVAFYKKADGKTKKKILGCIFSEKLIFEKGKSCNHPFSKPVSILLLIIKELQGS